MALEPRLPLPGGPPLEGSSESIESAARVFPPALVPVLRERLRSRGECSHQLEDELIAALLTTVFFASLETHEGVYHPIRVVFMGRASVDIVLPEGADAGAVPIYRWKVLRFQARRPFAIPEIVKLAAARTGESLYTAVRICDDERLAIIGLARAGFKGEKDPFIEVVATQPGRLSIRNGRDCLVEYERGTVSRDDQRVFTATPVRHALARAARAASVDDDGIPDYIDSVRTLVGEMAAHGRGGIIVVSPHEESPVAESAPYRMARDSSITALLRLSRRLRRADGTASTHPSGRASYGILLHNAFSAEIRRVIEEYGALTGIDGATLLNCSLALVAFGVILPVGSAVPVVSADEGLERRTIDLASHGTRHRAAATYAGAHPNSVVFVASEDGPVSCMLRESHHDPIMLWHLGPAAALWGR